MNCEHILAMLALAAGTWFWLWFLVWEYEQYKSGQLNKKWYNKDLFGRKK